MDWEKPMTNIALESEEFAVEEELHTKQMVLAVKSWLEAEIGPALAEECARAVVMCVIGGVDVREATTTCILHRLHEPAYRWPRLSDYEARTLLLRVACNIRASRGIFHER
jgi:hypothetical protein